jgi:hypothetical protein
VTLRGRCKMCGGYMSDDGVLYERKNSRYVYLVRSVRAGINTVVVVECCNSADYSTRANRHRRVFGQLLTG